MAIDFESFDAGLGAVESDDAMLSEINTTPLVDVMLVLLIIFLITIPVVNAAVAVTLPREANLLRHAQPQTVIVSVDAAGATYWFDAKLASSDLLQQRLAKIAAQKPQPRSAHPGGRQRRFCCCRPSRLCMSGGGHRAGRVSDRAAGFSLKDHRHGH
jgi:biopolymer transport protein ExbD